MPPTCLTRKNLVISLLNIQFTKLGKASRLGRKIMGIFQGKISIHNRFGVVLGPLKIALILFMLTRLHIGTTAMLRKIPVRRMVQKFQKLL